MSKRAKPIPWTPPECARRASDGRRLRGAHKYERAQCIYCRLYAFEIQSQEWDWPKEDK